MIAKITLLYTVLLLHGVSAQGQFTVLYLTDSARISADEYNNDQVMVDIIEDLAYHVTVQQISNTSDTSGYCVAFFSGAIGSSNPYWKRYKAAPLPMVISNGFAVKEAGLAWVSGNPEIDYGFDSDSVFVELNPHPITTGLGSDNMFEVQIINPNEAQDNPNLTWVHFQETEGVAPVMAIRNNLDHRSIVAINGFATLNGVSIRNRVVFFGIYQTAYNEMNDNGKKLLDNCIKWSVSLGCSYVINNINSSKPESDLAWVYPNPAGDLLTVDCPNYADVSIKIMDLNGRQILMKSFNRGNNQIDISNLSEGIYILAIIDKQTGEQLLIEKLVKK